MKKSKFIFATAFLVAAVSGVLTGCFFDGNVTPPSEPTYNVGYFNYTADGDSLPYGSEIINNNSNYYKSSEGLVLDDATCTGWMFDGWYEGAYWSTPQTLYWDDAVKLDEISKGRTGDINLYGKWHRGEFEISFDAGEGEFADGEKTKTLSFEFNANVDISSLEVPQRDGYDFYAWQNVPEKMPAENVTLDAEWAKKYSVSYVLNTDESLQTSEIDWSWSNDLLNPTEYSLASNISLKSATTTRPGYAFSGWYFDEEFTKGTSILREDKIPEGSENLTLYAKWERFFTSLDSETLNNLNTLGRRQKEIKIPHKYIDDDGSVKTITKVGGGGSSIFSTTIGYTVPQVEKVVIDEGITLISNHAFKQTQSLEEVVLPTTITRIGDNVFEGCYNLSILNLSNTFENLTSIGSSAFTNCSISFGKLSFHEKLKEIGSSAFSMRLITEIEIYSNTDVGDAAFRDCYDLEKVTVKQATTQKSGVTWVGTHTFVLGFDNNIGNFEVVFDSVYAYDGSRNSNSGFYGYINFAKTIKVQKDFVNNVVKAYQDRDNMNNYLNDVEKFTKTESGIYYVYTRI